MATPPPITRPRRFLFAALRRSRGIGLSAVLFAAPAFAIDFFPTPDAARAAHSDHHGPSVLIFGSTTCGWCRKLAADTLTDPLVAEAAPQFVWIKIDVDDQEALASKYGVRGLPDTIVVNEQGEVLGERAGYMPARAFVDFLNEAVSRPAPTPSRIATLLNAMRSGTPEQRRESVAEILIVVARVDAVGRDQVVEALTSLDPRAWAELVPYLSHPRLDIRAAAHGLLSRASRIDLPFDPFAVRAEREQQANAWAQWMADRGVETPPLPEQRAADESSPWLPGENTDLPPPPPLAEPLHDSGMAGSVLP